MMMTRYLSNRDMYTINSSCSFACCSSSTYAIAGNSLQRTCCAINYKRVLSLDTDVTTALLCVFYTDATGTHQKDILHLLPPIKISHDFLHGLTR